LSETSKQDVTIDGKPRIWKDTGRRVTVQDMAAGPTLVICEETDDVVVIEPASGPARS
jgi:hypothetical protein